MAMDRRTVLKGLAAGLGWLGSRLQNGQVAFYVAMFAVGAVLILRTLVR